MSEENKTFEFRTLTVQEIDCRVNQCDEGWFTLLLYKDARCDMNMLDEVVGSANWARDHKAVKDNMFCGVSIKIDGEWVTKWDCGTESNTEKEKGEASDSFKRACVNWGIGRELYTAPNIKIKGEGITKKNNKGKYVPAYWDITVKEIAYNDKREISRLVITGDGEVIYELGKRIVPASRPQDETTHTNDVVEGEPSTPTASSTRSSSAQGKSYPYNLDEIKEIMSYRFNKKLGYMSYAELTECANDSKNTYIQKRAAALLAAYDDGRLDKDDLPIDLPF